MKTKVQHVFYVDDDVDDLDFVQSVFHQSKPEIKVTVVKESTRAIDELKTLPFPDVILMDLNMPLMNGIDCVSAIRKLTQYEKVPIIMYSTSEHKPLVDKCYEAGANYFVKKPTSIAGLSKVVNAISEGEYAQNVSLHSLKKSF